MIIKINSYFLEVVLFLIGAVIMIIELLAVRILSPYYGASYVVWTMLIGLMMFGLSSGYFIGGIVADKKVSIKILSIIIFLAGVYIGIIANLKEILLSFFQIYIRNIVFGTFVSSLVILIPPIVLLGMVSPYIIKIKINCLSNVGINVGKLFALSTIGSIVGTFVTGFLLIPNYSNTQILITISIILIILSFIIIRYKYVFIGLLFLMFSLNSYLVSINLKNRLFNNGLIDIDSQYNRIWIYETNKISNINPKGEILRVLMTETQDMLGAIYLNNPDYLVFPPLRFMRIAKHFNPDIKKALLVGGGTYSLVKDFLMQNPQASIDVVELDPKLTNLAEKYFYFHKDPRIKIYHEDGRTFINKSKNLSYDVIYFDAFSGISPPYYLTTIETASKIYKMLNNNGVVLFHLISAIKGDKGKLLQAEVKGYKSIFPKVFVFPVFTNKTPYEPQNTVILSIKSSEDIRFESSDKEINNYLAKLWRGEIDTDIPYLTDDHAPAEYYILPIAASDKLRNNINLADYL